MDSLRFGMLGMVNIFIIKEDKMRIGGAEAVKLALKRLEETSKPELCWDDILIIESYNIEQAGKFAAELQKQPFI